MAARKISRSAKSNQQSEGNKDPLTLGQHLSAVLNSPNLPVGLHTGIWDCLGDIPTADLMDEPEFLDKLLKVGQEMAAKPKDGDSEDDEESKTVTMTKYQYEEIQRCAFGLTSIGKLMEQDEEPGNPSAAIDILANGILDILEDVEAGRLDHGKMVRPVPAEQKGGAA